MVETADMAAQYHLQGRYDKASEVYEQTAEREPQHGPELLFNQAIALSALGQKDEAKACLLRAVQMSPDFAEAHFNLGNIQKASQEPAEARRSYERAIECRPDLLAAHINLANLLQAEQAHGLAAAHYRRALALNPGHHHGWVQWVRSLKKQGLFDQALDGCAEALTLHPESAELYSQQGMILADQARYEEAHTSLRRALNLSTRPAGVHCNLGALHALQGQSDPACDQYERALALEPDHAMARWNRALLLLQRGEFAEGWREYQWRHNTPLMRMAYPRRHTIPTWTGLPYRGQRLLVHYEQGFGDLFQFARLLPWARGQGGTLLFECPPTTEGLFQNWDCIDNLIVTSSEQPAADIQCSLLDLPYLAQLRMDSLPGDLPYLHASPEWVARWRGRFRERGFRIGVVWSGSTIAPNRLSTLKGNACRLSDLRPLTEIPSVRLYGLQKGPAAEETDDGGPPILLRNLGPDLQTFMDTAAAIAHLDLVLSIDTAVAHLAGAMGKPTWLLLREPAEWRWLLQRQDSPWYPSMRLFRQTGPEGWAPVIERVAEQLRRHIAPAAVSQT